MSSNQSTNEYIKGCMNSFQYLWITWYILWHIMYVLSFNMTCSIFEIYWGEILFFIQMHFHNVWCIKNQTKHSSNALLSLVRNLMHQTLNKDWENSDQNPEFLRILHSDRKSRWHWNYIWPISLDKDMENLLLLTKTCYYLNFWPFGGCY